MQKKNMKQILNDTNIQIPQNKVKKKKEKKYQDKHKQDISQIDRQTVVKLKNRTRRLLSPMSQPGFIIQRDQKWHAVAVVYMNSAILHDWIK